MKIEPFTTSCTTDTKNSYEFKYDDTKTYYDNINDYKNKLDDYSRSKFEVNRQKSYKLTYITCIIYSVIALGIIFISAITDWGNNLFYNELYLFTMTFVVGSIIVISILVYKVYSFDFPDLTKKITNDAYYCPDYWISDIINPSDYDENMADSETTKKFFGDNNYAHFNIECSLKGIYTNEMLLSNDKLKAHYRYINGVVKDVEVIYIELDLTSDTSDSYKLNLQTRSGLIQDEEYFKFCQIAATMSGYNLKKTNGTNYTIERNNDNSLKKKDGYSYFDNVISNEIKVPLICNRIYPLFMAQEDVKYANKNNNNTTTKFRCAFSKLTGIPWSQIGCD